MLQLIALMFNRYGRLCSTETLFYKIFYTVLWLFSTNTCMIILQQIGSAIGGTAGAFYGFNHGISLLFCSVIDLFACAQVGVFAGQIIYYVCSNSFLRRVFSEL